VSTAGPVESFDRKIARAQEHFEAVEADIRAFRERTPYLIAKSGNAERTEYRVQVRERPSERLVPIIGDLLQDARSALDHLAWRLAGNDPPRDTSFPIYDVRDDYFAQNRKGDPANNSGVFKIARLPEEARTFIESVQPYNGTEVGRALSGLHYFARLDRHRAVHVVGGASRVVRFNGGRRDASGVLQPGAPGEQGTMNIRLGQFEDGTVIGSFTHPPGVEVELDVSVDVGLSVGVPGEPFVPLLPALRAFVFAVRDEVIPKLRSYLPAQVARSWSPDEPSRQVDLGFVDMNRGPVVLSSELPPDQTPGSRR
jgi:hypothetical protein